VTTAVLIAVAAAIAFGWSTAAMHSSAFNSPEHVGTLPSILRHVIGQPRWLSGMAASLLGLVLHAYALSLGSLVVVQPIVSTGLLWALGFGELLARRRPTASIIAWALVMASGLALFFATDESSSGRRTPTPGAAAVILTAGAVVVAVSWLLAPRVSEKRAGILLGAAAGVVFGLVAGTLKATTATTGVVALFTDWPVYVLLALGAAGFSLNQAAYNKVPLAQSLPILNIVNPIVALTYGVAAFSERPTGSAGIVGAELAGLAATLVGVFMLAREEPQVL
jgi:drug/metabolite transporter (DMT)-like permease